MFINCYLDTQLGGNIDELVGNIGEIRLVTGNISSTSVTSLSHSTGTVVQARPLGKPWDKGVFRFTYINYLWRGGTSSDMNYLWLSLILVWLKIRKPKGQEVFGNLEYSNHEFGGSIICNHNHLTACVGYLSGVHLPKVLIKRFNKTICILANFGVQPIRMIKR